jgi:hypothetical protein
VATVDVGDLLPDFLFTVTSNVDGEAAAPSSFTVVLTAPDNSTPAVTVDNPSTGVYSVEYVATMAGRYRAVGTATGNDTDGVSVLEWNVSAVAPGTILSLDDAKTYLRLSISSSDDEVRAVLEAVSDVCERFTRKTWRRTTFTETFSSDCSPYLYLRHSPVISVSSVVEAGVTITEYVLNKREGVLQRGTYDNPYGWVSGFEHITVTYVAGPADGVVPANILQGCRLLLQHMWQTQRGGSNTGQLGIDGEYDARLGFYIPNRVRQAWGEPRILVR